MFLKKAMPAGRSFSLQTQIILGTGLILSLVLFSTVVGTLSLRNLQVSTQTNSQSASGTRDLYLSIQNASFVIGLSGGLAVLLGVIAAIVLARRIRVLVNQINQAAQAMGRGELSARVQLHGSAELETLANAINQMAGQLQQTLGELEQRAEERAHTLQKRSAQLQAAAEIARDTVSPMLPVNTGGMERVSSVIEDGPKGRALDGILERAVHSIRDRLGFYHVSIFLVDVSGEWAVLQAASGEQGRQLLESNFRVRLGEQSIVSRAVTSAQPHLSPNVEHDRNYLKHQLLEETRSEMALPLKVGEKVIGVLDVQSQEADAFDEESSTILQIVADQLSIAVENARLFQELQERFGELETLYGRQSQETWQRLEQTGILGYQYEQSGLTSIVDQSQVGNDHGKLHPPLSIPISVRGQLIGSLDAWPEEEPWTEDKTNMLQAIGERISQAIDSARLFNEVQARAARERMLSQLTASFTQSLDFDALLKTAVQELGRLPSVSEVSIQIGVPETGTERKIGLNEEDPG